MTSSEIIDRFISNATLVGAEVVRVPGSANLMEAVRLALEGNDSVYCPRLTDTEKALDRLHLQYTDDYRHATASVEEVFGAIAETGSLVCSSGDGRAVQGGLLPRRHVAIVDAQRVFETLDDLFASFGTNPPTNLVLETGPSRTADIELTLTIGVHGPESLSILVIG